MHVEASAPRAFVPEATKPVQIDGTLSGGEWSDAAVLRRFGSDLTTPAKPPVTVYVKHKNDAILVAFRCAERDRRYPRAAKRSSTGNLALDDAVQVVLGLADSHVVQRDVLNMGGYDGAMGTQAVSADHYYQFTVNSSGASARTYNEVPLDRPGFESAVSKDSDGWCVEMRIPLASFGATAAENQTIFFNAFRFRPPERVVWYMPGFGGYYPMPLGQITLLSASRASECTKEVPMPASIASALKALEPMTATIGYYPLSGRIVGTITHPASMRADRAVLAVSGLSAKEISLKDADSLHIVVDIPKGSQTSRTAELLIYSGKKLIKQVKRDLSAVAAPEWVGTKAGQAYVREKIPSPWRQGEIQERSVALVDKKITFGSYAMPESVTGYGEILAGPAEIVTQVGERTLKFLPTEQIRLTKDGHQVRVESSAADGDATLQTRTLVDYDGFMVIKMKLSHIPGERLSRFTLRIPLAKKYAKYYHRLLVQEAGMLDGFGLECSAGPLWCGAEEQGLAFSYDTDPFASTDRRRQIRLVEEADRVWMELNFIDGVGQYAGSEKIFRFFLQPTPTKPMDLTKIHSHVDWQWEGWSDYQGYPDLAKVPTLLKWSDELHARGRLGLLYSCQGLAENSPGFKEFSEDLLIDPAWVFYRRAFNPGQGVPCYATCKRGPEGDLQLWGFEKLVRQAGIDGTVSDGLSIAWGCDNPGHMHSGGSDEPVVWDDAAETTIVAQRTFLKRLRGIFNESGRPFYMAAHTGGGLDINTLSFFDGYMEGEQLARYPRDYPIPPAQYIVGYSGRPWGLRTVFWEKTWRRQKGFFWSLTYALLHDNELEDSPIVRDVLKGFDDQSGTQYHPYWRAGGPVELRSATGTSKASCYVRKDTTLVIVGNMGLADDRVILDLSKLFPNQPLTAVEIISGNTLDVKDNRWSANLPAGKCLAIRIQTRIAPAKGGSSVAITSESWKLTGQKNGVSLSPISTPDGAKAMRLSSTQWADEARLELATFSPTPEGLLSLNVHHSGRLRIWIGSASLLFDSGWRIEGFVPGTGSLLQPTAVHDRFVPVEISVHDGCVDATYNGRPLCRGLRLPTSKPQTLILSTWAGDSIEIANGSVSTAAKELYLPGLGTPRMNTNVLPAGNFTCPNLADRTIWQINAQGDGVTATPTTLHDRNAWKLASTAYKAPAYATLSGVMLRGSGTFSLRIRAGNRFSVAFGDIVILHDGVWSVSGPLSGWSRGQIYQIPLDPAKEYVLTISIHQGLLNATLDDRVLVNEMQFDVAGDGNLICVGTWGGDSVEFCPIDLANAGRALTVPPRICHPVM